MDCRECEQLAEQAAIAGEEVETIRERIVAAFEKGPVPEALNRALEVAERTNERCMDAVQRHAESHELLLRSFLVLCTR